MVRNHVMRVYVARWEPITAFGLVTDAAARVDGVSIATLPAGTVVLFLFVLVVPDVNMMYISSFVVLIVSVASAVLALVFQLALLLLLLLLIDRCNVSGTDKPSNKQPVTASRYKIRWMPA